MIKQEAIEKLQGMKQLVEEGDKGSYEKGFINALTYALNVTKQLDEPEKPVVPQFVADYIEENRDALEEYVFTNVLVTLPVIPVDDPMYKWLNNKGIGVIVDCIRNGYEVEKEKLYTVELPNPNEPDSGYIVLQKDKNNKVFIDWHYAEDWKVLNSVKLTESEIKKDFAWAFQFAEEVKNNG